MKLLKLQLENFRSYKEKLLELSPGVTIFVGKNGLGKTNLLEAVYMLSLGRSFRSSNLDDLLMWDQDYLRCKGQVLRDDEEVLMESFYSLRPRRQKNFKLNDVGIRHSNYIGNFLTVLFHPQDLNMLYLSPSLRREYMDTVLCQTDFEYLDALGNYRKVLKQRNALLLAIRDKRGSTLDLLIWDQKIAEYGVVIMEKRRKFVEFLSARLEELYRMISEGEEKVEVVYKPKIEGDYGEQLFIRQDRDIRQGTTTGGPHRDDLLFYINGKEISTSASRGEFRTLLLAVKLGEIDYIKEKKGVYPILLLDDVFSELDPIRQKKLLKGVESCQTIITTTDLHQGMEDGAEIVWI